MKHPALLIALAASLVALELGSARRIADADSYDRPGAEHVLRPEQLPSPYTTPSHNNGPHIIARPDGALPSVPPGFTIHIFADHLDNPRNMALAPDGSVMVALSAPNQIARLRDTRGAGVADERATFAADLRQPFGLAFHDGYLYVGNTDSVVRFAYRPGDTQALGAPETVVPDLPARGYHNHWTRDVCFSADGKMMFVSVGSEGNCDIEQDERRAAILAFDPQGGHYRVYASGLRNAVGLAIDPVTRMLWACVNERDGLGDDLPPDYATHIEAGGFYGWPYAYIGPHPDPTYGRRAPDLVARTITPDVLIEAHSAAVNIQFATAKDWPAQWRGGAFVSLHGSWNREPRAGYKVVYIPMKNGIPTNGGYRDFMTGLVTAGDEVWGRPVGLLVAADGALLVCDDAGGRIWRIAPTQ